MSNDIPEEFICPITQNVMKIPVSLQCGHTFDKDPLEQWFLNQLKCPTCRADVQPNVTINWSLKQLIEKFTGNPISLNHEHSTTQRQEEAEQEGNEHVCEEVIDLKSLTKIRASYDQIDSKINLSLQVPDSEKRRPVFFVCVIDVSGSMDDVVGNAEGGKAFTRLDLVKHVLNVLISSLTDKDYLSLIKFSDESSVVLDPCKMTHNNKVLAKNYAKSLKTEGSTYTGMAVKLGYEVIRKAPENYLKSIILLTDGQDTEGDEILQRRFDQVEKIPKVQFNTFGFSNAINSLGLKTLAVKGNGLFCYIPDQSMIGTIFVNFIANTFRIFAQEVYLELSDGYEFANRKANRAILQYGTTKHFMINSRNKINHQALNKPLRVRIGLTRYPEDMIELDLTKINDKEDFKIQLARHKMIEIVQSPALPEINLIDYITSKDLDVTEFLCEFNQPNNKEDHSPNNEQIKLSFTYWNTWGAHYVRSFDFAHIYEMCLNFKAPSMAFYRSRKFDEFVDRLTDIFITLPPPKPTGHSYSNMPTIRMAGIMNRNNGCILSTCSVKLENNVYKKISELKKDDILDNGARVVCLIKSNYNGLLVRINDLVITPYHPIKYESKWEFPIELYAKNSAKELPNPYISIIDNQKTQIVCNLVLDVNHMVNVEGINCVSLGHGFDEDVVKHPYYGTDRVINDLRANVGWENGLIILKDFEVKRDEDGLVCGMNQVHNETVEKLNLLRV